MLFSQRPTIIGQVGHLRTVIDGEQRVVFVTVGAVEKLSGGVFDHQNLVLVAEDVEKLARMKAAEAGGLGAIWIRALDIP